MAGTWVERAADADARHRRDVSAALLALAVKGVLNADDRMLPGVPRAAVDHLVVAPTGVFVLDTRGWTGQVHVHDGALMLDGQPRVEDITVVRAVAQRLQSTLLTRDGPIPVTPVLLLAESPVTGGNEVDGVRLVSGFGELCDLVLGGLRHLTPLAVEAVFAALTTALPTSPTREGSLDGPSAADVVAAVMPVVAELPEPYDDGRALLAVSFRDAEGMEKALSVPLEEWMVFLRPEQRGIAAATLDGPALVRGAAGTGKSTVGLLRLAHQAQQPGVERVLWTSSLDGIEAHVVDRFARLAPQVVHRLEPIGLRAWCHRLLALRERPFHLDEEMSREAWDAAWNRARGPRLLLPKRYYEDEVRLVIRGRDLRRVDEYMSCLRPGRGALLDNGQRADVWRLAEAYEQELAARGVTDDAGLVIMALDELRRQGTEPYDAVLVDDAQDLSVCELRLVQLLCARPDRLMLLADEEQSGVPGGVTLAEAGLDVTRRTAVLVDILRSPSELAVATIAVVGDGASVPMVPEPSVPLASARPTRHGEPVVDVRVNTPADHDRALVLRLAELLRRPGVRPSDIAVLCRAEDVSSTYLKLLAASGLDVLDLETSRAGAPKSVRVGTYDRAKGLEYAHVLVPRLDLHRYDATARPGEGPDALGERLALARRRLLVAMTRATQTLWLGSVVTPAA